MAPRSGRIFWIIVGAAFAILAAPVHAVTAQKWVTAWAGSVQGPYPIGNPIGSARPAFCFPFRRNRCTRPELSANRAS